LEICDAFKLYLLILVFQVIWEDNEADIHRSAKIFELVENVLDRLASWNLVVPYLERYLQVLASICEGIYHTLDISALEGYYPKANFMLAGVDGLIEEIKKGLFPLVYLIISS